MLWKIILNFCYILGLIITIIATILHLFLLILKSAAVSMPITCETVVEWEGNLIGLSRRKQKRVSAHLKCKTRKMNVPSLPSAGAYAERLKPTPWCGVGCFVFCQKYKKKLRFQSKILIFSHQDLFFF